MAHFSEPVQSTLAAARLQRNRFHYHLLVRCCTTQPGKNSRQKILTPDIKRKAVSDVMDRHGLSEHRGCELADLQWSVFQYQKQDQGDDALRKPLRELANERRRFGYHRLGILLAREGGEANHKKLFRLYRE